MSTSPVRVPDSVHNEVHTAARVLGCNASDLLAAAWEAYRETPGFREDFEFAQKAMAAGDLDSVAGRMREQATERAARRAARVQALRSEG